MAAEAKAPTLADEYSLPPQEKPAVHTVAENVSEKIAESPTADETTTIVEEKSETPDEKPESEENNPVAEETSETAEDEVSEEKPEIKLETAPVDYRFPTTNQTRHCFTRYIEYHRCVAAKGEGAPECDKFAKYYRALCPSEWVESWNEQRENGTFPGPL